MLSKPLQSPSVLGKSGQVASPPVVTAAQSATPPPARSASRIPPAGEIANNTRRAYEKVIRALTTAGAEKRRRDLRCDEPVFVSLTNLVEDLAGRPDLAPSTRMFYRSALLWLARTIAAECREASGVDEAIKTVKILEGYRFTVGCPRSGRARPIPEADYDQLRAELLRRAYAGSDWAGRAYVWLMAGVLSGVRPAEWLEAGWLGDGSALVVITGKVKIAGPAFMRGQDGREDLLPHGDAVAAPLCRTIPIAASKRKIVQAHMDLLHTWLGSWRQQRRLRRTGRPSATSRANTSKECTPLEDLSPQELEDGYTAYYNGVRSAIRYACLKLWDGSRMYSLYSARHQFSANMRAEVGPIVASELMGHSRPDSPAAGHYPGRHAAHTRSRQIGALRPGQKVDIPRSGQAVDECDSEQSWQSDRPRPA